MSGNKAILDTNVIIFASKKQIDVEKLLNAYDSFCTSVITVCIYGWIFEFENNVELSLLL